MAMIRIPTRGNDQILVSDARQMISVLHHHSGGSAQMMLTPEHARQLAAALAKQADEVTGAVIVERAA